MDLEHNRAGGGGDGVRMGGKLNYCFIGDGFIYRNCVKIVVLDNVAINVIGSK